MEEGFGHYTCDNNNTSFDMYIKNISKTETVVLETCALYRTSQVIALSDEYGCTRSLAPEKLKFQPGNEYAINVKFNVPANQVGCYAGDVFFKFNPANGKEFLMLRYVRCNKSDEITEMLKPDAPFVPTYVPRLPMAKCIDEGELLGVDANNKLQRERSLPSADVPRELAIADSRYAFSDRAPKSEYKDLLKSDLTESNYAKKFNLLLHLEEIQAKKDISSYDMHATIQKEGHKYSLKVPGLAEKRPSVLKGDKIHVRRLDKNDNPTEDMLYRGIVHQVRLDDVVMSLGPMFTKIYVKNMKFHIHFTVNRLPDKLQHRAVTALKFKPQKGADYRKSLFPAPHDLVEESVTDNKLNCYNRNIGKNLQQSLAIKNIVFGTCRAPYIVYGPPGTGKTVTLVETIKQLVNTKKSKILVCAPSNSACDLLTERIISNEGAVNSQYVFRMHAMSRPWIDVLEKVKACSNHDAVDYYYPPREDLLKYNVISTTLITAGRLASAMFPLDHFDYVFIDEAGQAVEPESVVAVESVLGVNGRLVLAGDPHQLGPLLRSNVAVGHGLAVSILERLMKRPIYQPSEAEQKYDHRVITKLLNNYRSHKDIMQVPNECFYENELKECADEYIKKSLCDWEHLPKQNFPVIFHGVNGRDQREGNSPSFFNPQEASIVNAYVKKIMETKKNRVEPKDIGIIAPYRKQVEKIRKALEKQNNPALRHIKVGSVEEFQGQERRVVIISTVRSDPEHISHDIKHQLGFLTNPKRMNVSLTRAQSLLILVGNPNMLCLDKHWKKMLEYCLDNGGYTGLEFHMPEEQMEEEGAVVENGEGGGDGLAVQLGQMTIKETTHVEEFSAVQGQIHPQSRYAEH